MAKKAIGSPRRSVRVAPHPYVLAASPPTISSLNYDQGQIEGGGQSIVITGTNFTGTTDVSFLGTTAAFTVDSPTQITATLPAHAAGSGNLVITSPGGTVSTAFEYWTPAQLSCSLWNSATFSVPWAGRASAGTSGAGSFAAVGGWTQPSVGAAVGGYNPLSKDTAGDDLVKDARLLSAIITAGAYTVMALVKPNTVTALFSPVNRYQSDQIVCEIYSGGAYLGMGIYRTTATDCWFDCFHLSGGSYTGPAVEGTKSVYQLVTQRYDGTDLKIGVNAGAEVTLAKGNVQGSPGTAASAIGIGSNYIPGSTAHLYDLLEVIIMPSYISDANKTKVRKYCNQRYGVTV